MKEAMSTIGAVGAIVALRWYAIQGCERPRTAVLACGIVGVGARVVACLWGRRRGWG
jgi:hypothetical protein